VKSNIVGVRLFGGLGNQLFQYAAAAGVAHRLKAELRVNSAEFRQPGLRELGIHHFGIHWSECRHQSNRGALHRIARRLRSVRSDPLSRAEIINDHGRGYIARLDTVGTSCYLDGYFQSWRHLAHPNPFDVDRVSGPGRDRYLRDVRATNAVAVHIRRGDYLHLPGQLILQKDYYDRSRALLPAGDHRFFVFSDDPAAAQAELHDWKNTVFVHGTSPAEDILLMSECRNFIIANSTFSWWGAWLSKAAGKTVVAPIDSVVPMDVFYPPEWKRA
jgi:hypothetical protein